MRLLLLATTAFLLTAPIIATSPALADYKMAEAKLQAGDVAGAMPLLAEEAKLGNPVAAFNLAKIYEDGSGGVKDFTQAATYYQIAAEIDTAPRYNGAALGPQGPELIAAAQKYGQFALGRFYEAGKGVPQDTKEAIFWYTRAADLGLQQAMLKLAVIYLEGVPGEGEEAVPADPAQSVAWLEKAAELGNVTAMNELGRAYLAGDGVLANARVAADWFQKAADAGSLTAEYSLGSIYRVGFGGQPDYIRAVRHFERAANGKESASMVALGDLYANGQGVPQDRVQALTWYKLSALYGQPEGGKRGEALAATMSPEEQTQAKARAETWTPTEVPGVEQKAPAAASAVPMHVPDLGGIGDGAATATPAAATPAAAAPAIPAASSTPVPVASDPAALSATGAPAAPAPLPTSTPTAPQWVAPAAPAEVPPTEEVPAAAATPVPEAAAAPAAPPAAPLPTSTPTFNDNPLNPATNQPFDPFAPDPFALEPFDPRMPGVQPGAKPYLPPQQ